MRHDLKNTYRALVDKALEMLSEGEDMSALRDHLQTAGLQRSHEYLSQIAASPRDLRADAASGLRDLVARDIRDLWQLDQGEGRSSDRGDDELVALHLHKLAAGEWVMRSEQLLRWLARNEASASFDFSGSTGAELWELVALACLARRDSDAPLSLVEDIGSKAYRFAYALGLESVINGGETGSASRDPSVSMTRIASRDEVERTASRIADLAVPRETGSAAVYDTMVYVLQELLRNVVQHSHDRVGGVVAAKLVDPAFRSGEVTGIQIVVADNGIGIQRSLAHYHADIESSARAALTKALRPHISGAFEEGEWGSNENAGLGLFFVSEMAKATGGRFMLSSRGASLLIEGDPSGAHEHDVRWLSEAAYYPGTLVVVEVPQALPSAVEGFAELLARIGREAEERTPQNGTINNWLAFAEPPDAAYTVHLLIAAPSMNRTIHFVERVLSPRIEAGQAIAIDCTGMSVLTQSRAHELLFRPLRLAYEKNVGVYVQNACPAVARTMDFVQRYALQGLASKRKRR